MGKKGKKSILWDTLTYEKLYEEYITKNRTKKDIGADYGVSGDTIMRIAKKYGIQKTKEQSLALGREKCFEKYGTYNPFSNEEIKRKIAETNLKKFGVENPSQSEEIKKKKKETFLKNYGVSNIFALEETKKKIKSTMLEKYGVENIGQSKEIIKKRQETMLIKNGTKFPKQTNPLTNNEFSCAENARKYITSLSDTKMTVHDLSIITGYSYCQVLRYIKKYKLEDTVEMRPSVSKYEDEVCKFLLSLGIVNIERNKVGLFGNNDRREIDIYLPEYNLAIEFNGTFWHSNAMKEINYHLDKSNDLKKRGIELFHIYEYEWTNPVKKNIIESILKIRLHKITKKIYARNCEIREITNKIAKEFNENNHIQGHRDAKITYGLYYNDTLVQLMSFSKHPKYEWEIIRGCPGSNNIVIGGVGKLFNHFIKINNPKSVFSYCDYNKFNGSSYLSIGMKYIGNTGPDKKIIIDSKVYNRKPTRYKELKDIIKSSIYGAGSLRFLWKKEE